MKKLFAMALVALFVASTSGLVLAQTPGATPAPVKKHKKHHKKAAAPVAAPATTPAS